MNKPNPWRGFCAYDDDDSNYPFCGRNVAIRELRELIDSSLCCTLYGKSGTGKSSLLHAGIGPLLRDNFYLPVFIRLQEAPSGGAFTDFIIDEICYTIANNNGKISPSEEGRTIDKTSLYSFFSSSVATIGDSIYFPVIIIDQIEESFMDIAAYDRLNMLLQDLENAINPGLNRFYSNFRIVLSIREDDLYLLEDRADILGVRQLKNCRYRLRTVNEEEAREVIAIPGRTLFEQDDDWVCEKILSHVKDEDSHSSRYDLLLLSLTCSQLYDYSAELGHEKITKEDVENYLTTDASGRFYHIMCQRMSPQMIDYIEDHLVSEQGRRKVISYEDYSANLSVLPLKSDERSRKEQTDAGTAEATKNEGQDGEHAGNIGDLPVILQNITIDGNRYVELVHDRLANVIAKERNKRLMEQNQRQRKRRLAIILSSLCFFIALLVIGNAIKNIFTHGTTTELNNSTVLARIVPYKIKGPDVKLSNVFVSFTDLFNLENVSKVSIEGGRIPADSRLFEVDTLEFVSNFLLFDKPSKWKSPVKKIILHADFIENCDIDEVLYVPELVNSVCPEDSNMLIDNLGTVFVRQRNNQWKPLFKRYSGTCYYDSSVIKGPVNNATALTTLNCDSSNVKQQLSSLYWRDGVKLEYNSQNWRSLYDSTYDSTYNYRSRIVALVLPEINQIDDDLAKFYNLRYISAPKATIKDELLAGFQDKPVIQCKSIIRADNMAVMTAKGSVNDKKWYVSNDTLHIVSPQIKKLTIHGNIENIVSDIDSPIVVKRIDIKQGSSYSLIRNALVKGQTLVCVTNSNNVKQLFIPPYIYKTELSTAPKIQRLILFNEQMPLELLKNSSVIYVPYGQKGYYTKKYNGIANMWELSLMQTLYYSLVSLCHKPLSLKLFGGFTIHNDISPLALTVLVLLCFILLYNRKQMAWKKVCADCLICAFVCCCVIFTAHIIYDAFSQWPLIPFYIAISILALYCSHHFSKKFTIIGLSVLGVLLWSERTRLVNVDKVGVLTITDTKNGNQYMVWHCDKNAIIYYYKGRVYFISPSNSKINKKNVTKQFIKYGVKQVAFGTSNDGAYFYIRKDDTLTVYTTDGFKEVLKTYSSSSPSFSSDSRFLSTYDSDKDTLTVYTTDGFKEVLKTYSSSSPSFSSDSRFLSTYDSDKDTLTVYTTDGFKEVLKTYSTASPHFPSDSRIMYTYDSDKDTLTVYTTDGFKEVLKTYSTASPHFPSDSRIMYTYDSDKDTLTVYTTDGFKEVLKTYSSSSPSFSSDSRFMYIDELVYSIDDFEIMGELVGRKRGWAVFLRDGKYYFIIDGLEEPIKWKR